MRYVYTYKIILVCVFLLIQKTIFSQAVNFNFESTSPGTYTAANAVSGWTLSSQIATSCNNSTVWTPGSPEFSILTTPIVSFPTIGTILHSPLGGSKIARLNNSSANSSRTKIAYTFSVTSMYGGLYCAFAGVWEGATSHQCCEKTGFEIRLKDQSGNVLSCNNYSFAPGAGCALPNSTFSTSSTTNWTNWQVKYFDFLPYMNTLVTLEVISTDCAFNDHFGTLFFDAQPNGVTNCVNGPCFAGYNLSNTVNYCAGSGVAQLTAPFGYVSYQWFAPGTGSVSAPQGTMSTLTLINPVSNSVYSVALQTMSGCTLISTLSIVPSTISLAGIGSSSSCATGSAGSATVAAIGSGGGYTYIWQNATNSVVSTNSIASNLSPGTYSVQISASGSSSATCGTTMTTVTVGISPPVLNQVLKPFCNNEAYLCPPTSNGSLFQWYLGSSAISPSIGGTTPCYTITNPVNGSTIGLSYTPPSGCRDSIAFTLISTTPGSLTVGSNPFICSGANNGEVVLNMLMASGAPSGQNTFSVFSIGTTSPAYSSSITASTINSFTASNLSAGGTYSVKAFDGVCKYSTSFSVTPFIFNFTLAPSNTPTLCQGNSIAASVIFTSTPSFSQYTYTWTPSTFLIGGGNSQSDIISPSVAQGSSITLIYTVAVTPSLVNCPMSKTFAISLINPAIPTINPIPNLCTNSPIFTISSNPSGGFYSTSSGLNTIGIIQPTIVSLGVTNFTYTAPPQGTCMAASATGSFLTNAQPLSYVSGNLSICEGQTSTVTALGSASNYSWSNGSISNSISISPSISATYSVIASTSANCSSNIFFSIEVVPIPTLSFSSNTLCVGSIGTISASGASTYTWSDGSSGSTLLIPQGGPLAYTVYGANSQTCINSATILISSIPSPTLTLSGNTTICDGQSTTLLANGASSYSWSNNTFLPFVTISPSVTTAYTVSGLDPLTHCTTNYTLTLNVLPLPNVVINGDSTLCEGEKITLTASGANSYVWSNLSQAQTIVVSPTTTSTYSIVGTDNFGCTNSSFKLVQVLACVGLSEQQNTLNEFKIYPNPTNGNLFIETATPIQIMLYDHLGKLIIVSTLESGTQRLDLSTYHSGVYTLKIYSTKGSHVQKLIKTD